ncbi:hypothetical protein AB0P07_11650 [Streptomyces sp. NPDC085944]|uniref:hypothetical protein n=1 Tax=Streptomyces sp. NPDC085944 TaxID=3154962 RepID=UPI00342CBED9
MSNARIVHMSRGVGELTLRLASTASGVDWPPADEGVLTAGGRLTGAVGRTGAGGARSGAG